MTFRTRPLSRRGTAALEFAWVGPFLFFLVLGVWEVGRLIQVHQILTNATREGARQAAQGQVINLTGSFTQFTANSSPSTNYPTDTSSVTATVANYLNAAGISTTGLNVTFQYLTGNTGNTQPYQASKGQTFRVTSTLPTTSFRWTVMSLTGRTAITTSVDWLSMIDDPFVVDATIPTGY
jgi:Flp pilus assembly protein TadG